MEPIIESLLENDAYKFSMGQAIYHQFADYKTTWDFKCRNEDIHFTSEMVEEIKKQIQYYCSLNFKEDELNYLRKIPWIKGNYIDFLKLWKPCFEDFDISNDSNIGLSISVHGTWLNTSMYEVPTLSIVNEVYYRMKYNYDELFEDYKKRLNKKIEDLNNNVYELGQFSEFGLRRRLSGSAQELAVSELTKLKSSSTKFIGTSNVFLAKKYNVTPVGTMAHEWIMAIGQGNHKHNPAYSNAYALDAWIREYGILNGIALTDTITTECFLRDFDLTKATLFSGVRHDSGDPITWGDKMLKFYQNLGIDYKNKTLLFSDSLDFKKAHEIYKYFKDKCKVAFGIGTYISNDTSKGILNIVMKISRCNGQDVAKLSDAQSKSICKNPEYVDYLKRSIDWRLYHEKIN